MSKNNAVETPIETPKAFSYRNIKKDFYEPKEYDSISTQFHIELTENNGTKIVQDRNIDWVEKANKDADKVGLANILELARKRGESLTQFMFQDDEALDLSDMDPMDPNAVANMAAGTQASYQKLQSIASQLGCTTDEMLDAFIKGTLAEFIAAKMPKQEEGGQE